MFQDNQSFLTWKIPPSEKRRQINKGTFLIGPSIIGLAIIVLITDSNLHVITFIDVIWAFCGMSLGFILLLIINRFLPYPEKSYFMNDYGITVTKGNRKKRYAWDDFECFYTYSERYEPKKGLAQSNIEEVRYNIFETGKIIEGEIFYLLKRHGNMFSRLYKTIVVVHSQNSNTKSVNKFLSDHLQRKKMKATIDMGLVFYEFK